jgi:hypothetical protein
MVAYLISDEVSEDSEILVSGQTPTNCRRLTCRMKQNKILANVSY